MFSEEEEDEKTSLQGFYRAGVKSCKGNFPFVSFLTKGNPFRVPFGQKGREVPFTSEPIRHNMSKKGDVIFDLFLTYNPGNPKNGPRFTWRRVQPVNK